MTAWFASQFNTKLSCYAELYCEMTWSFVASHTTTLATVLLAEIGKGEIERERERSITKK